MSDIDVCCHWQRLPWVHSTKNLTYNVILSLISGLFTTCYHIAYFRWISPIKIANMTSRLLRSRDVKVMNSMLSCREFICAQSHNKFLSYLFRLKCCTAKSALGVLFPPIATHGLINAWELFSTNNKSLEKHHLLTTKLTSINATAIRLEQFHFNMHIKCLEKQKTLFAWTVK